MRLHYLTLATLLLAPPLALPHAVLLQPAPRAGGYVSPRGASLYPIKLVPFADAATTANASCGGTTNLDPGALAPVVSYEEGTDAEVTWAIAIKHPAAYTESGVRIALSYNGESFDRNVLAGGVGQAIAFTPLSAGPSEPGGDAGRAVVSLPAGKTCDACVLQFVWAAAPGTDGPQGGYYISCADVTIRARKARQHSRKVDHLMLSIFVSAVVFAVLSCVTRWLKQRWAAEEEEDALRRERESQSPDMRAMDMAIDEFELQAAAAKSGMRQCESSTTRC